MPIEKLNDEFGIPGQLEFIEGQGNLTLVHIKNKHANAIISLYAGQVLSFKPVDQQADLLFLSEAAYFQEGKAIKGGVPVCWPWFGPDPEDLGRAAHGFVRNRNWKVTSSQTLENGSNRITLGLDSNDETLKIWPHAFALRIQITVGHSLDIRLSTTNKDHQAFDITQALHTYFRVGNITQTQVSGLEGLNYLDKVDNFASKTQDGQIQVSSEVDRIYTGVTENIIINDTALNRRIRIAAEGSNSAVVWNPWSDIAASMGDLLDEEYQSMLCVETSNAGPDIVSIAPGTTFSLQARYTIE